MRLMNTKARWIWQQPEWPNFHYDPQLVSTDVGEAYRMHGLVEGKAAAMGLNIVWANSHAMPLVAYRNHEYFLGRKYQLQKGRLEDGCQKYRVS